MWLQWSRAGVIQVTNKLGVPESKIPRTNNHLEVHNSHLKHGYFVHHQHGGQLPRVDVWVLVLVTEVVPDFFFRRDNERALEVHRAWLRTAPAEHHTLSPSTLSDQSHLSPYFRSAAKVPDCAADLNLMEFESQLVYSMINNPPTPAAQLEKADDLVPETPDVTSDTATASASVTPNNSFDMWLDVALDSSQICPDLSYSDHILPSNASSSTSGSPGSLSSGSPAPSPSNLLCELPQADLYSNRRAILMQELLLANDQCADILCSLRLLNVDSGTLAPFVSPYNSHILDNSLSPSLSPTSLVFSQASPSFLSTPASPVHSESSTSSSSNGRKREASGSVVDGTLVSFKRQWKDLRKESYAHR